MSAGVRATLFFIPFPGISHLGAAVKMAERLADQDDRLDITVLVITRGVDSDVTSHIINSFSASRLNFLELPRNEAFEEIRTPGPGGMHIGFIELQKPAVRDAVGRALECRKKSAPAGFVIDMFCTCMIDVAEEFGIPTYVFFTCGAASLGLVFHAQSLKDDFNEDLKYGEGEVVLAPAFKCPVPTAVMPGMMFDKERREMGFDMIRRFRRTRGILINTFLELEPHAIRALTDDDTIPPVYPVGPILHDGGEKHSSGEGGLKGEEIIDWLDQQPDSSVVFLCFGSRGSFPENQVKEIAGGIELSGHRFLWSLRKPPPVKVQMRPGHGLPSEYENHEEVLPEGFSERTKGRGKVIGWAPQMAVLRHRAVGGFVSHCGWNSTLESVWNGVPVAAWPLGAEQQANAFLLVKELEMAVEIKMDYRVESGVVISKEKIGAAIGELMDLQNPIRVKVIDLKEKSRKTLLQSQPSDEFVGRFIHHLFAAF